MAATTAPARNIADVLLAAADYMAGLAYARVVRTDVQRALRQAAQEYAVRQAAQEYAVRQAAFDVLAGYLQTKGMEGWLYSWAAPRGRDEVAADLCAAAALSDAVHS